MKPLRWNLLVTMPFVGIALVALAGEPQRNAGPGRSADITLEQALADLKKQTGNTVEDRRSTPTNPRLKLPNTGEFWKTLDTIGKETGIGFSAYQPDGGVALVDKPFRELKTDYSGPFRFTVKRVAVSREDETHAHICQVTLDTAWEPRLAMLYLNLNHATVGIKKTAEKLDRQTARSVAGVSATEIELRMKAPPRNVAAIDSLKGELRVIGAPKMLEFKFVQLMAGQKDEQEGVKVRLTDVKQTAALWAFEILTEHPKGAIVELESYQSWMDNNRVWLAWTDPKTKRTYEVEPTGEAPQASAVGTKIRYYFSVREKMALPPKGVQVVLRYRTPNRVEVFTVPFSFRDLPLP
jgi:hypothetical protein